MLGSAVYVRRWRRDARRLLRRLRHGLGSRPLWLFSSGPTGDDAPDPDNPWMLPKRVRAAGERLGAREHVVFTGRVPASPRNFIERSMLRNTAEDKRDTRDLDAVRAWGAAIGAQLRDAERVLAHQ